MRGKDRQRLNGLMTTRITPAYAGKSSTTRTLSGAEWDHPCVCGEKRTVLEFTAKLRGSPLRMRGKDTPDFVPMKGDRITPAYAGKSLFHQLQRGNF